MNGSLGVTDSECEDRTDYRGSGAITVTGTTISGTVKIKVFSNEFSFALSGTSASVPGSSTTSKVLLSPGSTYPGGSTGSMVKPVSRTVNS